MTSVRLGPGSEVRFDDKNKCIRIISNAPLIPGMRGLPREVAVFHSYQEWKQSVYAREAVVNDDAISAIEYFWNDLKEGFNITSTT